MCSSETVIVLYQDQFLSLWNKFFSLKIIFVIKDIQNAFSFNQIES